MISYRAGSCRARFLQTAVVALCLLPGPGRASTARAADQFFLRPRDVVAFLGDSLTENGQYICHLEEYLHTQCPDYHVRLINAGWGGDRVTFGGEASYSPGALGRLDRDVLSHHPTVVAVLMGMNDGREGARDPHRLSVFREGLRRIIHRVRRRSHARVLLITTTPFDSTHRRTTFHGYDHSVAVFAQATREVGRSEGVMVVDLHTPIMDLMRERRRRDPQFTLMPDGTHLSPAGHLMAASLLLRAWHAPIYRRRLAVDGAHITADPQGCSLRSLRSGSGALSFDRCLRRLPLALDESERAALAGDASVAALCSDLLIAHRLSAPRYELRVDGRSVAVLGRKQLAEGVDLSRLPSCPDQQQSQTVSRLTREHFRLTNDAWTVARWQIAQPQIPQPTLGHRVGETLRRFLGRPSAPPPRIPALPPDLPQRLERLDRAAHTAAIPRWHHFDLLPLR